MCFNYKSNNLHFRKSKSTACFKEENTHLKFYYSGIITINIGIAYYLDNGNIFT